MQPAIAFDATYVPEALRRNDRWILWRHAQRKGKWTKLPIAPRTGTVVDANDSLVWTSFDDAMVALPQWADAAGVGYVFTETDGLSGVDLDECLDPNGNLVPSAREIVESLASYTEVSPSGTGVKVFVAGRKPIWAGCRSKNVQGFKEIEIYSTERYFTVTGRRLDFVSPKVEPRQEAIEALCRRFWSPEKASPRPRAASEGFAGDDEALLAKACDAKNGEAFRKLFYDGDLTMHGNDHSAADMALCCHLAFWTGREATRMDRLFRQSALNRDKWERADYRERTIMKAIVDSTDVYASPLRLSGTDNGDASHAEGTQRLPTIFLGVDEHRAVDEAVEALATDPDVYSRGTALVRVITTKGKKGRVRRQEGSVVIAAVPKAHLRERLTRIADFTKLNKQGHEVPAHPAGWLVNALDARGHWPGIRELLGVSEVPFLRPDGTICQEPGYDETTGVLYTPSLEFPAVPESPSRDDAIRARDDLLEIVCDFRFESPEHESAYLAGLLTPLARHAFDGPSPLFLVDANVRGAGKGLLVQTIGQIVLGRSMPVSSYCSDDEEMRKQITSIAIAGDPVILLDNLEGKFGSGALDRALTTTYWKDRILGKSEQVSLPLMSVWYGTGNNVLVGADTARRIIHIRLDVLEENPEHRTGFQHPDLIAWVKAERGRLLVAALTILVAYCRSGRPSQKLSAMGSFEGWSALVREAVVWAGLPDPCLGSVKLAKFADSTWDSLAQFLSAWRVMDPSNDGMVAQDLIARLYPADRTRTPNDESSLDMRAAIEQLVGCPPGKSPNARALGNRLKGFRRRVIEGYYIDIDPKAPRRLGAVWKVFETEAAIPI